MQAFAGLRSCGQASSQLTNFRRFTFPGESWSSGLPCFSALKHSGPNVGKYAALRQDGFCLRAAAGNSGQSAPLPAVGSAKTKQKGSYSATPTSPSVPPSLVGSFLDFLNDAWTQFHATAKAKEMLLQAGFQQLNEGDVWAVEPGGKYFLTRNMSTIIAFSVGQRFTVGEGVRIVAAHTDSPCLKLKPVSSITKHGYLCVGVQPYGGGLWHTWFDRDLSVAGRVIHYTNEVIGGNENVSANDSSGEGTVTKEGSQEGKPVLKHSLVRIEEPIMRIPTLAIHLDRTVNSDGFKPNLETQVVPVLATSITAQVWNSASPPSASVAAEASPSQSDAHVGERASEFDEPPTNGAAKTHKFVVVPSSSSSQESEHHPALLQLLAQQLGLSSPSQIIDFELNVCDTQPSCLGGAFGEFIFSGRLDNLACSYIALEALIHSSSSLEDETGICCVALFDNEEVGSESAVGAASPSLYNTLSRMLSSLAYTADPSYGHHQLQHAIQRSFKKSFLVSADMAHGIHPNFPERHEERHQPRLHHGFVIKHNANQRYATNLISSVLFKQLAAKHSIPCQSFVVRNDMGCGSTVGPILASALGIRTIDVGLPQLSMHSIREMCATDDIDHGFRHILAFFSSDFGALDNELDVDN